jgi:hypothetical protein
MALTTRIKNGLNEVLRVFNLRIGTRTEERREGKRLRELEQQGHFGHPVFPVPSAFEDVDPAPFLESLASFRDRFDSFERSADNSVGYTFDNNFYTSPDAEVLYTMVRRHAPSTVVEVGSGNSTKIVRQALRDGHLDGRIEAIDPEPRADVQELVDRIQRRRVESGWDVSPFEKLREGDVLVIDSSHAVRTGNDVAFLYLRVLPSLSPGVIIHVHDIFIPFEYPREWVLNEQHGWNEQYLVHALLRGNSGFDVLWPGRYMQYELDEFSQYFPHISPSAQASSLWLRRSD